MRLTGLTLRRYGPFAETSLSFDPAPGRINVVLAPNGAGKSVLRHAFGELLFGIGGQTPMGFRHGYGGMQLSAAGFAADGSRFVFTRRKGLKNTLTGEDDAPVEQAWLDRLLGHADAGLVSRLFALDTERLRQGGRDLLNSGGVLADALLAAAGGLREASALRRTLEEERDKLAPLRRTATRPFYVALDRWSESRRQLKESVVRPREWAEREAALHEAEQLRDASNRAAAEAGERLRRLERVRRVRPLLMRQAAAAAWLEAHPHAPGLPPDLADRLPAARAAMAHAGHRLETARAYVERLGGEAAAVATDNALLASSDDLQALTGMAGLVAQASAGLPDAEAALAATRERVAAGLAMLGHPGAPDPTSLVPSPALVTELRRLIADHAAREAALAGLPRRAAEQRARLAEAERALAASSPRGDPRRLEDLLTEIRREGDPSRSLTTAVRSASEAEARLSVALSRLPSSLRNPEALAALDPPTPEALERLAELRDAAGRALERREEAVGRAGEALAAVRNERTVLEAAGTPPTRAELAQARARREAGWSLLFRRLSGEAADPAAEQAYGGARPLALAYADAVATADRLADDRWADAERVTRAERLGRALAEREAELGAATESRNAARQVLDAAEARWSVTIGSLGSGAGASLAEVQRVLAARNAGLAAQQEAIGARAVLAEVLARQADAAARLLDALGGADTSDLSLLLDRADARVQQQREARNQQQGYLAAADAARDSLRGIDQEHAEATAEVVRWQSGWAAALEQLGQAPGLPPSALVGVLDASETLAEGLRETTRLGAQAASWRAALERFRAGYEALCGTLRLPVDPDAMIGVRELDRRHRAEAARAERRAALLGQLAKEAEALRRHEEALARSEAALRAVVAAAGAATPESAEKRIALGAERARQQGLLAAAEAELLAAGDGLDLGALRTEAEAHPSEGLEALLEEAQEAQRGHAGAAQAQVAAITALDLELQRMAGDQAAVRAASDEAAAASMLGQTLDDALLMQVAAGLLDAALDAVQEGSDDVLLRRISSAFTELTGGAYTGVFSREDERGVARLTLRSRDFPDEEAEVDQLSEGTRDQLFLALRLVAIADQAASGTVVPFVGDDILQSFDDFRAAAAFRALLRLSETTQVILLSHHEHLLDVLRATIVPSSIHLQRVGR